MRIATSQMFARPTLLMASLTLSISEMCSTVRAVNLHLGVMESKRQSDGG